MPTRAACVTTTIVAALDTIAQGTASFESTTARTNTESLAFDLKQQLATMEKCRAATLLRTEVFMARYQ